jgi:ectoine hydroxylase-related dioxygenase (phytanoyl-CoA dioxygenase family)
VPDTAAPGQTELDAARSEAVRRVLDDGWAILPGVVDPGTCDEIAEATARLEAELGIVPADNVFEGRNTVRIYNLLARGPVFEQIPVHPGVLGVIERVLDDGLLVSSLSSIAIDPGEVAQLWHADDQLIPIPRPHVPLVCNTMWALTDFTRENGATRLIPRSHHRAELPEPFATYDDTVYAEMSKGSVLVWLGSVWHGGGANTTDTRRLGIAMNYCAGFIRQQENQQLGLPPGLVAGFGERLRELVGYSIYRGLLGHVDKEHPAAAVLGTGSDATMVWEGGRARR